MKTRLAKNRHHIASPLLRSALEIHWAWPYGLAQRSSHQLSSISLSIPTQTLQNFLKVRASLTQFIM